MKYQGKKHDIGVKSRSYLELDLSSTDKQIRDQTLQPLCPKPRRPPFLTPLSCNLHSQQQNYGEGTSGILNRLMDKMQSVEESSIICCMVPSCGSPPRRTRNLVVHDVHFINNQMDHIHHSSTRPTKINF